MNIEKIEYTERQIKKVELLVTKRNNKVEEFDAEKINKVLLWATDNISGVSASDVAMNAQIQFFPGIKTSQIHQVLIQSAVDLISDKNPNYQFVASNLLNYLLRKEVFETKVELPPLLYVIERNIELGLYDRIILDNYTHDELDKINTYLKHKRDYELTYAGLQQLIDKYLVKDRSTGITYETPQYCFMMIALTVFAKYDDDNRMEYVKNLYDMISKQKISLPTPIMAGIRTPNRQFSSCTLIEIGDSLNSIFNGNVAIGKYVAKRAGIGINVGSIRALGSKVKNGEVVHTGVVPFFKMFESTLHSCSQGGIRKGCLKKDTLVKVVDIVNIDGIDYKLGDSIEIDGKIMSIFELIKNQYKLEIKYKDVFIQDIKIGDVVKSFDIESEKIRHNRVGNTILPIVEKNRQIKVSCEDGSSIVTSIDHPMCYFNTELKKWAYKKTGDIQVGDILKTQESQTLVLDIKIGLDEDEQFYDLTVERDNNFFAGDDSDKMIVVHNSATLYFPWWHREIEDVLVLKNNKGTDDNRVRHIDYGIQFEKLFYSRFISNSTIALFSPSDVPNLYDSFGLPGFEELYTKYEANKNIKRKTINARDLMNDFAQERIGTGRMYVMNIDNANSNSPFCERLKMSNLCVEIILPVSPVESIYDIDDSEETEHRSDGEIALCTLAAFNLGNIKTIPELYEIAEYIVRILDYVIDNQDYPINAAKKMLKRRSVGVGVTNFAYWLAKQGVKYSEDEALFYVDELFEHIQFSLLKASNKLAKEFGPCEWFDKTTYSKGVLPIDRYNKNVDSLIKRDYSCDWESLRKEIQETGLRNSVLTAIMPAESSAVVQNATNGIEPIRALVITKKSKSGLIKQVAPECLKLKNKYEYAFEMPNNKGYTNICAVIQKWIDQSISANHYYQYSNDGISMSSIIKDILYAHKYGLKTLYYANTDDKKTTDVDDMGVGCDSGACSI